MPAFILMVAACFLGRLFVKMAYRPATYAPTLHTRPSLVESVSILLIGAAVMRVKNTIAMIIMSWLSVQVVSFVAAAETITWSGYEWTVRSSRGATQGPGPNIFSDSRDNVFVDAKGDLHLRITQARGQEMGGRGNRSDPIARLRNLPMGIVFPVRSIAVERRRRFIYLPVTSQRCPTNGWRCWQPGTGYTA